MIERVALHQTRLQTPGLGLDAKGVAIGAKGLVVLPSIDRLVMLLALYTHERSLEAILPTLAMHVLRTKTGAHEIALELAAESSDRMDRVAEAARLVGGRTFTGTSRHFVQYRDALAPFGYDARDLASADAAIVVYSDGATRAYDLGDAIDLRSLLLRLVLRPIPARATEPGVRFIVAEQGLGPALLRYLVRSRVEGDACVAEWPPESALRDTPVERWIVRVPELPKRMRPLLTSTPGMTSFLPAGPGVAVEEGYEHPLELRACPVFAADGLVLLRGRAERPWIVERLPRMGALSTFARVELRAGGIDGELARRTGVPEALRVPLRLTPSSTPWRKVTGSWVPPEQFPLLRRLAYALPRATIAQTRVATTERGVFLLSEAGIEAIPLGTFYVEVYPRLYLPAGFEVTPSVAPEVLARSLAAPASGVVFVGVDARACAIEDQAFTALEAALIDAPPWEPMVARTIERALAEAPIDLRVSSIGLLPTQGIGKPNDAER
jgi:hypothetical protein